MRRGRAGVLLGLAVACGSKSGLLDSRALDSDASAGVGGAGGVAGAPTGGGSGSSGAGAADASVDAPPPPPCRLTNGGSPIDVVTYPEGSAGDVDLALIDGGGVDRPARVAYLANSDDANFWHPELRVAEIAIGSAWPSSVQTLHAPVLWGFDAHSGGVMSSALSGKQLALAFFHADEASPNVVPAFKFRSFDVQAWAPGNELVIDATGVGAYDLATGENGYAVAYRGGLDGGLWEPRVAVVDAQGALIAPPVAVAPAADYPGTGAAVVPVFQQQYMFAVNFSDCPAGQTVYCAPRSIGIGGVAPFPELGIWISQPIAYLAANNVARRPSFSRWGDQIWLAWREASESAPDGPWQVRVAGLTNEGFVNVGPILVSDTASPVNGVSIHVSDLGVIVSWAEVGADPVGPSTPGHSLMHVHQLDFDGSEIQDPFVVPVTELAYDPPHAIVTLAHPRSLLIGWAGRAIGDDGPHRGLLARLDCVD